MPGPSSGAGAIWTPNWREVIQYVKKLSGQPMDRAVGQSARVMAAKLKKTVQQAYDRASYRQHELTLAAYRTPPLGSMMKRAWGETNPLKRSSTLRDSVVAQNRGRLKWYVGPNPRKLYTAGDPQDAAPRAGGKRLRVAEVAYWMEHGLSYTVRATPPMLAYLAFLCGERKKRTGDASEGKGSTATKGGQGDIAKKMPTFAVTIPPKPIYGKIQSGVNAAFTDFSRDLWQRMQLRTIDQQRPIRVGMMIEGK